MSYTDSDGTSRRKFLTAAGAVGVGLSAGGLFTRTARAEPGNLPARVNPSDGNVSYAQARREFPGIPGESVDEIVLNYALTLEILEADLYRQALNVASGRPKSAALSGDKSDYGLVINSGLDRIARNAGFTYLVEYAYVEAAHRDFLTSAITASGGTPTTANPDGYAFSGGSPGTSLDQILTSILALEETGVRAYLGAVPYLTDLKLAVTAGGIYSTECRHSAAIRNVLGMDTGPSEMPGDSSVSPNLQARVPNIFEYGLGPPTVIAAAGAYFR